jgi:hypothetical protein
MTAVTIPKYAPELLSAVERIEERGDSRRCLSGIGEMDHTFGGYAGYTSVGHHRDDQAPTIPTHHPGKTPDTGQLRRTADRTATPAPRPRAAVQRSAVDDVLRSPSPPR